MALGQKTGGRRKGTPNKVTADVKVLAQEFGPESIERLASLMRSAENEATSVAAAKELLDRGYGKSVALHEIETTHRYVARLPEKAKTTEQWQQQHPQPTIQ